MYFSNYVVKNKLNQSVVKLILVAVTAFLFLFRILSSIRIAETFGRKAGRPTREKA